MTDQTSQGGGDSFRLMPDFDGFAAAHPWIGAKAGDLQTLGNGGYLQQYQNASVYGQIATDPHEVHGAIRDKYLLLGGPSSFLGYPTSDQTVMLDGLGGFNEFQGGAIYWHPSIGAFEVHGPIRDKLMALGKTMLACPLTDESPTADGVGRYNHFRTFLPHVPFVSNSVDSSIYWSPSTGAFEVEGAIRDAWSGIGWETSFLGYPVSDEHDVSDGDDPAGARQSDFQNGSIRRSAVHGIQVRPQWAMVDTPSIAFGSGISVGGYGRLTLFSDGTTHFQGHLHDSGLPSFDCLPVFAVKDADGHAYQASHPGRVHGSDEPGSRDLDWDDWGTDDNLRQRWARVRAGWTGGSQVTVTSDWSPQKIAEDVVAVVGAILSLIPLMFSGGTSNKSSDPNYGRSEDYPPGGEPPPGQEIASGDPASNQGIPSPS